MTVAGSLEARFQHPEIPSASAQTETVIDWDTICAGARGPPGLCQRGGAPAHAVQARPPRQAEKLHGRHAALQRRVTELAICCKAPGRGPDSCAARGSKRSCSRAAAASWVPHAALQCWLACLQTVMVAVMSCCAVSTVLVNWRGCSCCSLLPRSRLPHAAVPWL